MTQDLEIMKVGNIVQRNNEGIFYLITSTSPTSLCVVVIKRDDYEKEIGECYRLQIKNNTYTLYSGEPIDVISILNLNQHVK